MLGFRALQVSRRDAGDARRGIEAGLDATMLMLCLYDPVPLSAVKAPDISLAIPLKGRTMKFSDLGSGEVNYYGFRQFLGWYTVTAANIIFSIETRVYVGPNAGSAWSDVQPIVDSVRLAG